MWLIKILALIVKHLLMVLIHVVSCLVLLEVLVRLSYLNRCQTVSQTNVFSCSVTLTINCDDSYHRNTLVLFSISNICSPERLNNKKHVDENKPTFKSNATNIVSLLSKKEDDLKITNPDIGNNNTQHDVYSGDDLIYVWYNFSNSWIGYGELKPVSKTPKGKRTKRSRKTKITLSSLPKKDVLKMLDVYYKSDEYTLDEAIYDLDSVKNVSNAIAKALFDFSVENLLDSENMRRIFQNGQFLSGRPRVDEKVMKQLKNDVKKDSSIVDAYIDEVLYASSARIRLGLEAVMPIYTSLMKYRMEKVIKDTIKKYGKP